MLQHPPGPPFGCERGNALYVHSRMDQEYRTDTPLSRLTGRTGAGEEMAMRRRTYVFAAAALALAGGGFGVWAAAGLGAAPRHTGAAAVTSVIILDPGIKGEVFAPPPPDAAPKLTARQAIDVYAGKRIKKLLPGVTVQLGLFTLPVGDASICNSPTENCSGETIVKGILYSRFRRLVYGLSSRVCPAGSHKPTWRCTRWDFIDANTGKYLNGLSPMG